MKIFRNIATILFLVTLWGCTKTEVTSLPDKAVTYRVAEAKAKTKAGEVSFLGEFANPSDAAFSSVGFLHGQGVSGAQSFYNGVETISWDGSNRWAPSSTYYWPKGSESYVNFISWYDKLGTPDVASITETSISWTNRSIAAGDNIMLADMAWRYNANESVYHIDDAGVVGVPTLFHHMLTRVCFHAKPARLSDSGTTWTVTILNFTLKNVHESGSLSLRNADPSATETVAWTATDGVSAPAWTVGSTTTNVSGNASTALTTLAGEDVLAMRSFLPQSLGIMAINFDYKIRTTYDADNFIEETAHSGDLRLNAFTSPVTEWGMNRQITYTITIDPQARVIEIDPYSTAWTTQPTQAINIE